jgi:pimeloyl-ACP methyl ester carboxylesterase
LIYAFLLVANAFANGQYTTIESGVTIYSELYPNSKSKFKGTIIFENGSGLTTEEWTQNKQFLTCVKQYGSLFIYDRNGLGKSPADLHTSVSNPITAALVNNKLIKLLKQRHVSPPYILVGHSYGGLYVDYFARKYPDIIKGILMVDPLPNNSQFTDKFVNIMNVKGWDKIPNKELYDKYSYANAQKLHLDMIATVYYQFLGFEETKRQINLLPPLLDTIPLIIISSVQMENADMVKGSWFKQQKQYLNKNIHSKIITTNSGHLVQLEQPQFVCDQIQNLVNY